MSKTTKKQKEKCIGLTQKGKPCRCNAVKDHLCSRHWKKIYSNALIKSSFNSLQSRYSDTNYYLTKLIYNIKHNDKEPESIDLQEKKDIFGDLTKCFITGNSNIGAGDHFFEINGYYEFTGFKGKDNNWNRLPVNGDINNSYKIFSIYKNLTSNKSDIIYIGYQKLTTQQINQLQNDPREIKKDELLKSSKKEGGKGYLITRLELYNKIQDWLSYCESKNIQLKYKLDETDKYLTQEHQKNTQKVNIQFVNKLLLDYQFKNKIKLSSSQYSKINNITHKKKSKSKSKNKSAPF